jgi:hypothetical protein
MELMTIKIIVDIKTGQLSESVAAYLIDDYQARKEYFEALAKIPLETLFSQIQGYTRLSLEDKATFNRTIIPFCQCQGRSRLVETRIHHIEHRDNEKDIRVYLIEDGEEGYQYFHKNGEWS